MAEALRNPDFGFVDVPREVIEPADFTAPEVEKLKGRSPDMVVVFTRTWDPLHLLENPLVSRFLAGQYGYQREMRADEIAEALSMNVANNGRAAAFLFRC